MPLYVSLRMEVIEDELQKNGVPIDKETLSQHIHYILNHYRDTYNDSVNLLRLSSKEENVLNVFHEMDVNTPGRAVAYLTLVYRMKHLLKEETVRQAVRLTAHVLKNAAHVDGSFIRKLVCAFKYGSLNLLDLF